MMRFFLSLLLVRRREGFSLLYCPLSAAYTWLPTPFGGVLDDPSLFSQSLCSNALLTNFADVALPFFHRPPTHSAICRHLRLCHNVTSHPFILFYLKGVGLPSVKLTSPEKTSRALFSCGALRILDFKGILDTPSLTIYNTPDKDPSQAPFRRQFSALAIISFCRG